MIKIEMTPYEQKDLLEILEFAKETYTYRGVYEKQGMSKYWIERIEQLKVVVEGKAKSKFPELQSSMKYDR